MNPIIEQIRKDRYQKNNESRQENFKRVAGFCANGNDRDEAEFFDVMDAGLFFPGGRVMSNAGIGSKLTLQNCFTACRIEDDMKSIFEMITVGALTHKSGGGIGYDFSTLRPNGMPTNNDAIASGAVSFMEVFDKETACIQQGGRRGANMGVMAIYHPDILEFVKAKSQNREVLKHFNLSVMVDDAFMNAVENHQSITLHFPVYDEEGKIINDESKWEVSRTVQATDLWNVIMESAYSNGEPGILFYDTMNRDNNLYYAETITHTNPCGEFLCGSVKQSFIDEYIPYKKITDFAGACNLGSLYIHKFVRNPFTDSAYLDYERLKKTINVAVRMLDNIIDITHYPIDMYKNYQKTFRTIGLGATGLADALVMLGMRYDSREARDFVDELFNTIALRAYQASVELAKEKEPFPAMLRKKFAQSNYISKHIDLKESHGQNWMRLREDIDTYGIRNARILSVAPVGTGSMVWGENCSSGIEPIFSLEYDRKIKIGGQDEKNEQIVTMKDYAWAQYQKLVQQGELDETQARKIEECFVTALEIDPDHHITMLGNIAKHIDMSVSKTINVPTEYTLEQVKDIYKLCWSLGIKGCTIFRPNDLRTGILIEKEDKGTQVSTDPGKLAENGSNAPITPTMQTHTLVSNTSNNTHDEPLCGIDQLQRGDILAPYDELLGRSQALYTGCGKLYCELKYDEFDGSPWETWLTKGSGGGCERNLQFISRLMSLCLRGGIDISNIISQAMDIDPCPAYIKRGESKGSSCPTAIGYAMKDLYDSIQERYGNTEEDAPLDASIHQSFLETCKAEKSNQGRMSKTQCPECGEELVMEGGCNICKACGYSSCGL